MEADRSRFGNALAVDGVAQLDVAVAIIVGVFTIAWAPIFIVGTVPRLSIAYGLIPLGLALVFVAARNRDRAAVVALLVCVCVVIAGILAEAPRAAFVGQLPEWASVLALIASIAWWGLGRSLTDPGRRLVATVLALGGLLNGVVALAQLVVGTKANEMFVLAGRGAGLMANPVFFGSFMVGVSAMWISMTCQQRTPARLVLCGALMFFTALSGGRVVLGASLMVIIACAMVWKREMTWPASIGVIGFAIGDRTLNALSTDVSSINRLAGGESIGSRIEVWRFGLDAAIERPLFGWGPANAELAIMRRLDLAFVQDQWSEGSVLVWWDPHNVVVFLLVSLGLLGTTAVGLLVVASIRGERHWPELLAAAAMCATWMLQPFTVHTLPVAMLLLGAAARPRMQSLNSEAGAEPVTTSGGIRLPSAPIALARWQRAALGTGALIAVGLLSAAFLVDRWSFSNRPDDAARAAAAFGGDPWLDSYISRAYLRAFAEGELDSALLERAVEFSERSARTYPTSEQLQDVADLSVTAGDIDTATDALERSVELEPWDPTAYTRLYSVAKQIGDEKLADLAKTRLCAVSDYWCEFTNVAERDANDANP